jgi:peptidyl-tRNA hydrolase, PTH1 family
MPALIIGLGNPGGEYARTRHNVGWMVLEELERRGRFGRDRREGPARIRQGALEGFDTVIARPQTYMNLSGRAGLHLTNTLGIPLSDVIVVHDEADFSLGKIQVKQRGSAAGHKGVQSLIDAWRSDEFVRIRIGVGHPGDNNDLVDHVLDPFVPDEKEQLPAVIGRSADAVVAILRDGVDAAMTTYNRAPAD